VIQIMDEAHKEGFRGRPFHDSCSIIARKKGEKPMSRVSKLLLFTSLIVFALACNFVTQPISDAQEAVETVQSLATAMPIETLQSFATAIPFSTLEALPSALPEISIHRSAGRAAHRVERHSDHAAATAGRNRPALYSFKADASTEVSITTRPK
jgi:hypothetical protein